MWAHLISIIYLTWLEGSITIFYLLLIINIYSLFITNVRSVFTQVEPVGSCHCSVVYYGHNTGRNRGQRFPSHQPHHHSHHEGAADRSWFVLSALLSSVPPWSIFLPCKHLHSSALCLLASVDQTRLCMSPSGSLLFHRLLSRSRSLCRKSPDGCNEKFSSHSHSTYFLHTHSQAYTFTTHTVWEAEVLVYLERLFFL